MITDRLIFFGDVILQLFVFALCYVVLFLFALKFTKKKEQIDKTLICLFFAVECCQSTMICWHETITNYGQQTFTQ